MADKETGLNITIGAVADENSAKKAVKDIQKTVDSSVKGGRIAVPVDINVPIDKNKDKLTKAQKVVIDALNKMTSKGFSASGKDIDDLISKFNDFTKALDQAGKGRQNKIFREIRKQVEEIRQMYKDIQSNKKSTRTYETKTKNDTKKSRSKEDIERKRVNTSVQKQLEKQRAKTNKRENARFVAGLERGAGRGKAGSPEADINLGHRTSNWDDTYTGMADKKGRKTLILQNNRLGTYFGQNSLMKRMVETERLNRKAPVTTTIDKEKAASVKSNMNLNDAEIAVEKAVISAKESTKELGGIEHGREDADPARFKMFTAGVADYMEQAGKSDWDRMSLSTNMSFNRYNGDKGTFGLGMDKPTGEGLNHEEATEVLKDMMDTFTDIMSDSERSLKAYQSQQRRILAALKDWKGLEKLDREMSSNTTTKKTVDKDNNLLVKELKNNQSITANTNKAIENQTRLDIIEHSAERLADTRAGENNRKLNEIVGTDAEDGFNSEANTQTLLSKLDTLKTIFDKCPCEALLKGISDNVKIITDVISKKSAPSKNEINSENWSAKLPTLVSGEEVRTIKKPGRPKKVSRFTDITDYETLRKKMFAASIQREREQIERGEHPSQQRSQETQISKDVSTISKVFSTIKSAFGVNTDFGPNANDIMAMNEEEQRKIEAQLIERYGLLRRAGDPNATRDRGQVYRTKALYGWGKNNVNPFADLKLTEGINIDSKGITEALQKAIQKNMFKAQTGGWFSNLIGPMTLYAGQPSLEKSRAEIDALNTVMANLRDVVLTLLQGIQTKELQLRGLEETGKAKFNANGTLAEGSSNEAITLFAQLEEQKMSLNGVLAELAKIDDVSASLRYNAHDILKVIGFVNPLLKENNKIVQNVNAGLDKNGKALKFQKRSQEILNYSFQLMGRHIGQMVKNWMLMLNPINMIKKSFSDFASYDIKWQRTMNVIKYNLRRIIRPFMEWLAQQLVNIIGLINAIAKGIGSAFGQKWDLFDQSAANAEKMREELEAASNITAGFDELHDIGSDNTAAGDLMGDIYTPQWDGVYDVLENIGAKIGSIIKTVSNWNFWDWLKLAGTALVGFLAIKTLINWFGKGKNPLKSVADGFSFLEKAVGWALLIWAFTEFTKALTDFVDCMKDADWEDIGKALTMLGGALLEFGVTLVTLMGFAKLFGTDLATSLGLAAMVASFAALINAFSTFAETIKDIKDVGIILDTLAKMLTIIGIAITGLLVVLGVAISTGIGAIAIAALAGVLAAISMVITAISIFVVALGQAGEGIKLICEGISQVVQTIGNVIIGIINAVATGISITVTAIAKGVATILTPILEFVDSVMGKIMDFAAVIAHEIGETIRTVIKTTGDVIIGIIEALLSAIPKLLDAILRFCREIGPAIETSVGAIMRTITKLINFIISGIEYMVNTLVIGAINGLLSKIPFVGNTLQIEKVSIERFAPKYEKGTNYVPNDGLAYLHQGEAVIPKKYNTPYQQDNSGLVNAIEQLNQQVAQISNKVDQGIDVHGQFVQKGSDLVATVQKANNKLSNNILNNKVFAR